MSANSFCFKLSSEGTTLWGWTIKLMVYRRRFYSGLFLTTVVDISWAQILSKCSMISILIHGIIQKTTNQIKVPSNFIKFSSSRTLVSPQLSMEMTQKRDLKNSFKMLLRRHSPPSELASLALKLRKNWS